MMRCEYHNLRATGCKQGIGSNQKRLNPVSHQLVKSIVDVTRGAQSIYFELATNSTSGSFCFGRDRLLCRIARFDKHAEPRRIWQQFMQKP